MTTLGVAIAIGFTVVAGYPSEVTIGTAIAGAGIFIGAWQNTLVVALQSELKLGSVAAADVVRQIVTTASIALLVVAGAGLIAFFAASPVAFTAMLLATFAATQGLVRLRPAFDLALVGCIWPARQPSNALATALGVLYFQIALISVSLLSTETEAGFYGAAFRVVELANGVPWILATSAFPLLARASHNDADRLRYATQRLLETALVAGGLFAVVIAVGAPLRAAGDRRLEARPGDPDAAHPGRRCAFHVPGRDLGIHVALAAAPPRAR